MTDTEILQNRVKDFVYIYGQYYDNQSGVKSVTVSETHTNTETGGEIYNEKFPDIEYVNTPGIAEFTTDETTYFTTYFSLNRRASSPRAAGRCNKTRSSKWKWSCITVNNSKGCMW